MADHVKKLPKIAIFDLTDCEGCESEFINLREKLTKLIGQVDIANWRLGSDNKNTGPFDITFIEGTPITTTDIEIVKQARAASKVVVSLGACADLGGVQSWIGAANWRKDVPLVYGKNYKTTSKPPKPISYYIDVDYRLPGCPINQNELARLLGNLLVGKSPEKITYPVCLECKAKENECLLIDGEPCLGPITRGGCEAICPSRGLRCWGCFGVLEGSNLIAMKNNLESRFGKERAEQILATFMSQQDEFKALYINRRTN